MVAGLDPDAYDALVAAAETYRAAIVVRLGGEAGLRTDEVTRVATRHLRDAESTPGVALLAVPADASETPAGRADGDETIDRETVVPASLAAEIRRYATENDLGDDDPVVDVSARRVQMIVGETVSRAAETTDAAVDESVTPRDLRQTFARRLLVDRGVDPRAVRDAGGWESLSTLDPYLGRLDGEELAAAVAGGDADREPRVPSASAAGSAATPGFEALADAGSADPTAAVPDGLTAADRWAEAWVVRRGVGDDRATVAAAAGTDPEALADRGVVDGGPWLDAMAERDPVRTDGCPATGGRPAVAVPSAYDGVVHGALCVVAADGEPVGETERRELAALGRCLGRAVTAVRWRELLHSDAVVEVEFRSAAAFLARATDQLDCRIELVSTVDVAADASRIYLTVSGARPQDLAGVVDGAAGVSDLRVRETREDGGAASVSVDDGSLVTALVDRGATVREATAADGRVSVIADFPQGTTVGPIADDLRDRFGEIGLASKESVARSPRTESSLRDGVADRFTDRQWTALSAAYHGGYFDWPRGSTAEEVADAMGVSSPTFHNHLRKAQRALLDELFEGESEQRARRVGRDDR